jgi:hypothetical protein
MIPSRLSRRLLRLLLTSRQNDEIITFMDACEACAARPYAVLKALHALGSAGLVDPVRLRLTFEGLAVASALATPPEPTQERGGLRPSAGPRLARRAA